MCRHIIKVKLPKFRLTCCRNSFSFSRKLQVSRSVSGNLAWRKNCHLHTCLWPKWSPHPLQGNTRCLGRYKGVILLLGTSPLRSHFISPFSLHRSLYLISYSRVWLPRTSRTPFIFIWKTHLVLEGWHSGWKRESKGGVFGCWRDWGELLYHMLMSSCRDSFHCAWLLGARKLYIPFSPIWSARLPSALSRKIFKICPILVLANTSFCKVCIHTVKLIQLDTLFSQRFESADHWKSVPFIRQPHLGKPRCMLVTWEGDVLINSETLEPGTQL